MPIVLSTMYEDVIGRAVALLTVVNLVGSKSDGGWKLIECIQSFSPPASSEYPKRCLHCFAGLRPDLGPSLFRRFDNRRSAGNR